VLQFTSYDLYENLNKPYVYHVQLDILYRIQPEKIGDWKDKMPETQSQCPRAQAGLAAQNIELDSLLHPTGNQARIEAVLFEPWPHGYSSYHK
jgi:hypothetical protein